MDNPKSVWAIRRSFLQCYFIMIATILGTGVLGLPVTLSKAGMYPLVFSMLIGYFIQILTIIIVIEILQYCKAIILQNSVGESENMESDELLLMEDYDHEERERLPTNSSFRFKDINSSTKNKKLVMRSIGREVEPNHFLMGNLFLHKYIVPFYMLTLFLHLIGVLISYSLAGSEAYGQIFHVSHIKVIPFFTWTLAIIIIIGLKIIQPVIAVMTLGKGSLILATVIVTMYVGFQVNCPISNDWRYIEEPFLMGTIALGGIPVVMPMLSGKFDLVKEQMQAFRNSTIMALTTCLFLNLAWCWAVLSIVPQSAQTCQNRNLLGTAKNISVFATTDSVTPTNTYLVWTQTCSLNITLEKAKELGQISTVPLTEVIEFAHPEVKWIAITLQCFVVISVTVSFLTLGAAAQHTICGLVDEMRKEKNTEPSTTCFCRFSWNWFWQSIIGILYFLVVFVVAILEPEGFIDILEKFSSLCLNFFAGPFVFMMLRSARSSFSEIVIPLKTNRFLKYGHYVILLYGMFAVIFDIVTWILGDVRK